MYHIAGGIRGYIPFPKVCPKMNVITRLEFELAYLEAEVQNVSHYPTGNWWFSLFSNQQLVSTRILLRNFTDLHSSMG